MTRWARSGNSQKHKKMPKDPSTWEELSIRVKKSMVSNKTNFNTSNFVNSASEANSSQPGIGVHENKVIENKTFQTEDLTKKLFGDDFNKNNSVEKNEYNWMIKSEETCDVPKKALSRKQLKKLKWENNKDKKTEMNVKCSNGYFKDKISTDDDRSTQKSMEENENWKIASYSKKPETLSKEPISKKQMKKLRRENSKKQETQRNNEDSNQCFNKVLDKECSQKSTEANKSCEIALNSKSFEKLPKKSRSKRKLEKLKLKKSKKQKIEVNSEQSKSNQYFNNKVLTDEHSSNKKSETSKKSFSKKFKIKNEKEENNGLPNQSKENSDDQNNLETKHISAIDENRLKRKEMFLQKLKERRAANGITLLSPQMENKLYRMKKGLWKNNFAPEEIKNILRKERRKLELEFRKSFVKKTCFNCRKFGHVLADCPLPSNGTNQGAGICFKCGSAEHNSSACKKRVSGYPFATCFICKAEGHISRDCPNNKHGIYINGGKCNLCGNINHLSKDCPKLKNKEEEPFTLPTINEGRSVDDEIVDFKEVTVKNKFKNPKIVKF